MKMSPPAVRIEATWIKPDTTLEDFAAKEHASLRCSAIARATANAVTASAHQSVGARSRGERTAAVPGRVRILTIFPTRVFAFAILARFMRIFS